MIKVKTFTSELKALHAMEEIHGLDSLVNQFIEDNNVKDVISVSDTCTSGDGNSIGIIRVLTYKSS